MTGLEKKLQMFLCISFKETFMKSVKIVFGFASIALLLAVGCFLAFLFLPGNMTEKNDVREEDSFVSMEPLTAEEQA